MIPQGHGLRRQPDHRRQPDPPAPQQERGQHPQDRRHHRQLGRVRVPAPEDRRRRRGVHARGRKRPHQPFRGRRSRRRHRRRRPRRRPVQRGAGRRRRFPSATTLWGSTAKMMGYDLLIFSCEGSQFGDVKTPYLANVKAYADAGGRLFLDHLHYYFLRKGPAPFPSTAAYIDPGTHAAQPVHRHHQHRLPEGRGAGRLDGRARRLHDARPDADLRAAARRDRGPGRDAELDLHRQEHERSDDAAASGDPVHDVQHAGRGRGRRAVRARGVHRRSTSTRRRRPPATRRTSPDPTRRSPMAAGARRCPRRRRRWSSCSSISPPACSRTR